jgi:hypothetical protein
MRCRTFESVAMHSCANKFPFAKQLGIVTGFHPVSLQFLEYRGAVLMPRRRGSSKLKIARAQLFHCSQNMVTTNMKHSTEVIHEKNWLTVITNSCTPRITN